MGEIQETRQRGFSLTAEMSCSTPGQIIFDKYRETVHQKELRKKLVKTVFLALNFQNELLC